VEKRIELDVHNSGYKKKFTGGPGKGFAQKITGTARRKVYETTKMGGQGLERLKNSQLLRTKGKPHGGFVGG